MGREHAFFVRILLRRITYLENQLFLTILHPHPNPIHITSLEIKYRFLDFPDIIPFNSINFRLVQIPFPRRRREEISSIMPDGYGEENVNVFYIFCGWEKSLFLYSSASSLRYHKTIHFVEQKLNLISILYVHVILGLGLGVFGFYFGRYTETHRHKQTHFS